MEGAKTRGGLNTTGKEAAANKRSKKRDAQICSVMDNINTEQQPDGQ